MSYDRDKHRYYSKQKYEAAIGTFATGIVFLFVAILSLVLRYFPAFDFIGLSYWGVWLFIPAFFIFIGGFSQLYTNNKFKKAVKNAILDRGNQSTFNLEDLALEVGIKPKDVLRVLVDLRSKGEIKYRFNSDTGEIVLGEEVSYTPVENFQAPKKLDSALPSEGKNYCVYCGNKIREGSQYCAFCGSKL
ncbi:MAG: zinc ribbon domain-containing protein [Promethearchaeota archaeon]|nr:MAG: zinc ribbon domain-containing protein [Candidatus Lokiarchaeota archaeon]